MFVEIKFVEKFHNFLRLSGPRRIQTTRSVGDTVPLGWLGIELVILSRQAG